MATPMIMVSNILGIDRINMDGKTILIKEQHNTNANFLVNAILSHALKRMDVAVCLILCHNTFGHYHNIGMKLGYNLLNLKKKGRVTVVEPMKIIASSIIDTCKSFTNKKETIIPDITSTEHVDIAYRIFAHVKEKYDEAARFTESVVLIIDDINHFLDLGLSVRDTIYFIRYLRSFISLYPLSQLCILAHTYQEHLQTLNTDVIANVLKHMAHVCVIAQPFKTGHFSDTSGKLIVYWKTDSVRSKYHLVEKTTHLFKLLDWQVKICAPGTMSILS
ncbi:PREDICTED: elongator complex protein 6 [Cyphomyrmex costatus]|uniref:Elongator complex protein 6 n=1 Tax=Cyphomyrmex costatus TaxID=456900 RepID=A0A151I8E5_9HYME|nr:PREDICTED: elongator complex protein 6 [Cyphomyrmex costatus]KYM94596.1 UPF0405 protein C3orf75 like protein [Cyphomyrmex costatus]